MDLLIGKPPLIYSGRKPVQKETKDQEEFPFEFLTEPRDPVKVKDTRKIEKIELSNLYQQISHDKEYVENIAEKTDVYDRSNEFKNQKRTADYEESFENPLTARITDAARNGEKKVTRKGLLDPVKKHEYYAKKDEELDEYVCRATGKEVKPKAGKKKEETPFGIQCQTKFFDGGEPQKVGKKSYGNKRYESSVGSVINSFV